MQSPQYMWPQPTNACSTSLLKHTRHCQLLRAASSSDSLRAASCRNSATAAEACTHTHIHKHTTRQDTGQTCSHNSRHIMHACTHCMHQVCNAMNVCDKHGTVLLSDQEAITGVGFSCCHPHPNTKSSYRTCCSCLLAARAVCSSSCLSKSSGIPAAFSMSATADASSEACCVAAAGESAAEAASGSC